VGKNSNSRTAWSVLVALTALAGACAAVSIAWLTKGLLEREAGYADRGALLTAQFVVAVVGLVPVFLSARAVMRRSTGQAVLWLAAGIVTYLGSGVLNDQRTVGGSPVATEIRTLDSLRCRSRTRGCRR
jgi:hypothetical protein